MSKIHYLTCASQDFRICFANYKHLKKVSRSIRVELHQGKKMNFHAKGLTLSNSTTQFKLTTLQWLYKYTTKRVSSICYVRHCNLYIVFFTLSLRPFFSKVHKLHFSNSHSNSCVKFNICIETSVSDEWSQKNSEVTKYKRHHTIS